MLEISKHIHLEDEELHFDYIRSAGPGGQNVNKVATACQLRFDVRQSPSIPEPIKTRLIKLAGSRMTDDVVLVIEAKRYRTQEQNRADAILRLTTLIQKATIEPKTRRPTRPSLSAKAERVDSKKKRGETKLARRIHPSDLE
ncbi:MAG: aminoacyl-tRNA hydrolase [Chloroflexi bacterium HGW-Chloroflexi-4]|jgi:ribosome-associated protein|nr:MAG: aminoacyl-tRNA hydrolase [Chloroflexi bacterium HGW-Chloroflexi-4]